MGTPARRVLFESHRDGRVCRVARDSSSSDSNRDTLYLTDHTVRSLIAALIGLFGHTSVEFVPISLARTLIVRLLTVRLVFGHVWETTNQATQERRPRSSPRSRLSHCDLSITSSPVASRPDDIVRRDGPAPFTVNLRLGTALCSYGQLANGTPRLKHRKTPTIIQLRHTWQTSFVSC